MSKKFVNELGNDIELDISEKEISGVEGILISIKGPDSETENYITRREAEILNEELSRVLK